MHIFRVLEDSFGNKLIKSLKDHPWHIVYNLIMLISSLFQIYLYIVVMRLYQIKSKVVLWVYNMYKVTTT